MALGSFAGGVVIPYGRRKTMLIFNTISIISLCSTLILNLPAITIGKLAFGFSSGVINVAGPKMLDETVPGDLLGAFGIATNAYICLGIGLATIVGAGLPEEGDIQGFIDDEFWRFIYGFPLVFCFLLHIVFMFYLKEDSIIFSIKNGKIEDAMITIKQVYQKDQDFDLIYKMLKD